MSETLKSMKDAVMGGQGGGLQSISGSAGDLLAENTDTRGSKQTQADDASKSLNQYAKGNVRGVTTEGTPVKADEQVSNMQTGTSDHLGMGFRKEK